MNNHNLLKNLLYSDVFASPFQNMSAGHIKTGYKRESVYFDNREAQKDHLDRWRMPGLYSSIMQMSILSYYIGKEKITETNKIEEIIVQIFNSPERAFETLRFPTGCIRNFVLPYNAEIQKVNIYPCSVSVLLTSVYSAAIAPKKITPAQLFFFLAIFTCNSDCAAAVLFFDTVVRRLEYSESLSYYAISEDSINEIISKKNEILPAAFSFGINSDSVEKSIHHLLIIMSYYSKYDIIEAQDKHLNYVNTLFQTPVKRLTIDHPLILIPFAISLAEKSKEDSAYLPEMCSLEGGETILLSCLTSILRNDIDISEFDKKYQNRLVNKNLISKTIDAIVKSRVPIKQIIDFFDNENKLTEKENETRLSITKHVKKKTKEKPKKSKITREQELSQHIVESWTKRDKSRWKKERRRMKENDEE
jgi:hypothetical protein